jgi:hypothetical protein
MTRIERLADPEAMETFCILYLLMIAGIIGIGWIVYGLFRDLITFVRDPHPGQGVSSCQTAKPWPPVSGNSRPNHVARLSKASIDSR